MRTIRRCQPSRERRRVAVVGVACAGHSAEPELLVGREIATRDCRVHVSADGLGRAADSRNSALVHQLLGDHWGHVGQWRIHRVRAAANNAEPVDANGHAIAKHAPVLGDTAQPPVLVAVGAWQAAERLGHVDDEFALDNDGRVAR